MRELKMSLKEIREMFEGYLPEVKAEDADKISYLEMLYVCEFPKAEALRLVADVHGKTSYFWKKSWDKFQGKCRMTAN